MDWFLYDIGLRYERVKKNFGEVLIFASMKDLKLFSFRS